MAEPSPSPRDADHLDERADPALGRLLRDLDTLWTGTQPPPGLERAIARLAQQPRTPRRFQPRRMLLLAAAVVVVALSAGIIAATLSGGSANAPSPATGPDSSGSVGVALASPPATPVNWAAPGTMQALGGSGLAGSVDTYSLPSGQLVLDVDVTGSFDALSELTWALVPDDCAAWMAPVHSAPPDQPLYQFMETAGKTAPGATHQTFRQITPELGQRGPLALIATRRDSETRAACADLSIEPYTALMSKPPASAAPASCPVTRPPSPPFIPPSDYAPVPSSASEFWYGNAGLFVLLPADGTWIGLPHDSRGYGQKVFWGHQGYDYLAEPQPDITVTGRRLDGSAPPLTGDRATNAESPEMGSMMLVGVNIPAQGCWQITGEYQGQTLSFVVWVGANPAHATPDATPTSATSPFLPPARPAPMPTSPTPTPIPAPATPVAATPPCRAFELRLALGQPVAEPTGQHSLSLTLTNHSDQLCSLDGYPAISLFDTGGRQLPFDFTHSGDQVVTTLKPTRVDLPPGGVAYVTINKYRCDAGEQGVAAGLRLVLPGDASPIPPMQVAFPAGTMPMGYCGPGDPGTTVAVSPVEATFQATLRH